MGGRVELGKILDNKNGRLKANWGKPEITSEERWVRHFPGNKEKCGKKRLH